MLLSSSNIYPLVPRNILFERNGLYISLYKELGPSLPSFRLRRHFPRKRTNSVRCNSIIHRYYNIYIPTSFLDFVSSSFLPFAPTLLIFFAHEENTPSFDSISILSTHGPHVSLFLFLSLPLSLFNPSITLDFIPFVFISRRNERSVEHVYLRECILSRYSAAGYGSRIPKTSRARRS